MAPHFPAPNPLKPSVIAAIKGGLGNQLFCYAAGRALALRSGRALLLDTRTGFRRDGYQRRYRLDRFPIDASEAAPSLRLGDDTRHPRHKLARAVNRLIPRQRRSYLAEDPAAGPEQLLALCPTAPKIYLNGYWQDEAYFDDHADQIRRELSPPAPTDPTNLEITASITTTESVFVHIRRNRYSPRLAADYYREAVERLRSQLPSPRFFLFGDDPDWATRQLDLDPVTIVDTNPDDEIADLFLMAQCRHAIVANSSFSWWGAWLIGNAAKRVLTPATPGWPIRAAAGWAAVPNTLETGP